MSDSDLYIGKIVKIVRPFSFISDSVDVSEPNQQRYVYPEESLFLVVGAKDKSYKYGLEKQIASFYILKPLNNNSNNSDKSLLWIDYFWEGSKRLNYHFAIVE